MELKTYVQLNIVSSFGKVGVARSPLLFRGRVHAAFLPEELLHIVRHAMNCEMDHARKSAAWTRPRNRSGDVCPLLLLRRRRRIRLFRRASLFERVEDTALGYGPVKYDRPAAIGRIDGYIGEGATQIA